MPRPDGAVPLQGEGRAEDSGRRFARSRGACSLGLLLLLLNFSSPTAGGSPIARRPGLAASVACGDAAADNYGPRSTVDPGDNRACEYSCPGLRSYFTLPPTASACYVSGGSGHEEQTWPPQPVEPLRRRAGSSCTSTSDCSAGEYCINGEYCSAGNNTFTVPSWGSIKAVIIQGYALAGAAGDTLLGTRRRSAGGRR